MGEVGGLDIGEQHDRRFVLLLSHSQAAEEAILHSRRATRGGIWGSAPRKISKHCIAILILSEIFKE